MAPRTTKHPPPSAEQIADLTEAVLTLTEQVRCLRISVDEIESELGWAVRSQVLDRLPPPQFACDARFELPGPADFRSSFEHACDPADELYDPAADPSPTPAPLPSRQVKFW